jgi:hypothetical protein
MWDYELQDLVGPDEEEAEIDAPLEEEHILNRAVIKGLINADDAEVHEVRAACGSGCVFVWWPVQKAEAPA